MSWDAEASLIGLGHLSLILCSFPLTCISSSSSASSLASMQSQIISGLSSYSHRASSLASSRSPISFRSSSKKHKLATK